MVSLFKAQLVIDWSQTIYNMENNPLYEMRSLSNDTHSHKTQTTPAPVASPCVYMTLLIAPKKSRWKTFVICIFWHE